MNISRVLPLLFFISLWGPEDSHAASPAIVTVSYADIWSEPAASTDTLTGDKRETQVLLGEKVTVLESSGPWLRVQAIQQPEYSHHQKWEGYPGWMLRSAVESPVAPGMKSWTAELAAGLPKGLSKRERVMESASKLLGLPYVWGGLSPAGVDCSGLVHLSFRVAGQEVPRDSLEQWMKAKPIKRAQLKPADLVFAAKVDTPRKISHVCLYRGQGRLIEAPQTGMVVRDVTFVEKFGKDLSAVESGDIVGDRVIYYGRLIQ